MIADIPYWGASLLRVLGGIVAVLLPAGTLMMRGTLAMIGPAGSPSQSWSTILVASRTSWSRTQQRE